MKAYVFSCHPELVILELPLQEITLMEPVYTSSWFTSLGLVLCFHFVFVKGSQIGEILSGVS